ncbi:MAG: hypothetical protein LBD21_03490 [Tannerellaceae bacterium]|jgi:hypothetical protein|nr:hypothetical protein [Tannerellaceae bacterium]
MKKYLISLTLLCVFGMACFAQTEDKPAGIKPSPELEALTTAHSLAKYGYANYSASALIGAAEILSQVSIQKAQLEKEAEAEKAENTGTKTDKPEITLAGLIADAKKFAAGDATMLAWADRVEKAGAESATRGPVGGPSCFNGRVYANRVFVYHCTFRGGMTARVYVSGDGDTDLDLYVYDANGNFIGSDDDYTDECVVMWTPRYTGSFTIRVVNRGNVYNDFQLCTY